MEKFNATIRVERPIFLRRENNVVILAFKYDERLVNLVKTLPYARYNGEDRTWMVELFNESIVKLRSWFLESGLTDVCIDELIGEDEEFQNAPEAILRSGSVKRPYIVVTSGQRQETFDKFRSIPSALWEKNIGGLSYGPVATGALVEMVNRGILLDQNQILSSKDLTITYDGVKGKFKVFGNEQADEAFQKYFPEVDIYSKWVEKGLDVGFSDYFAEEIYRGELARKSRVKPEGMLVDLYPYQEESVAIAIERDGFAIFDAPGVGKTPQAIAVGLHLLNNGSIERVVIVTPGAVKTQFAREIKRFTGSNSVVVIDGDKRKRTLAYERAKECKWVILNYDLLALDTKMITPLVDGSLLVADEVHKIKGRTSKRGQIMRQLGQRARKRLALSGTPVENDPSEWFTIMSGFVVPGLFGNAMDYFNRYSYPGRFGGFEGARNLNELRERSKMHYIRRNKSEIAQHLPELRVENLVLDPDEKLKVALRNAHKEAQREITLAKAEREERENGQDVLFEEEGSSAMTAVSMLRLMCSSPRLLWKSESKSAKALCEAGLVPEVDGPKLDELRSIAIEMQENDERLVVFTSFRKMAELIAERFKEDGVRYVLYTGSSNSREREKAVEAFTARGDGAGTTVFIATDAASEGLNLGKECSTLINFDLSFKPSTMIQRGNRIHRVDGRTDVKYRVINFTISKTIEEGIIQMIGSKADLSDSILGEKGTRQSTTGRRERKNIFEEAVSRWDENISTEEFIEVLEL